MFILFKNKTNSISTTTVLTIPYYYLYKQINNACIYVR